VLIPIVAVLLVCLAITGAGVAFALNLDRKHLAERNELERRLQEVGEELGAREVDGAIEAEIDGQEFFLSMTYARNNATGLLLETPARPPGGPMSLGPGGRPKSGRRPRVLLRRESWVDRLGKFLRINHEVQTGDRSFDDQVYLESDAQEPDVARLLGNAEAREGMLRLLDRGAFSVVVNEAGDKLSVVLDPRRALNAVEVRAACADMRQIAEALPSLRVAPGALWLTGPVTAVVSAVLTFAGVLSVMWMRERYCPLTDEMTWLAAAAGLFSSVIVLPFVAWLVRGRPESFRLFTASGLLLLIALPLLSIGIATGLNGAMDQAAPIERTAHIQAKWTKTWKGGTTYYVEIQGVRGPLVVPVTSDIYAAVREGEDVVVAVGRGRFGWEWLRGIRWRRDGS